MRWRSVVLLCEDRAHLDFLRAVASRYALVVRGEPTAPRGRGDASDWVIAQIPQQLQAIRHVSGLGLLVAVDGDNKGRSRRVAAIVEACARANIAPLGALDPVALLVPTWSIDTWALYFHRELVVDEDEQAKHKAKSLFLPPHPGFMAPGAVAGDAPRTWKPQPLLHLVDGFLSNVSDPRLPSIDASRGDLRRWLP